MMRFVLGWLLSLGASLALAQDFPKAPVRLIVPFTAGGPTDTIARLMSIKLQDIWAQSVVIDYKPGGGTTIGTDFVAKSAPDGHTIGVIVSSYSINPSLRRTMPFDTLRDLSGVTRLTNFPLGLMAHPGEPYDDLKGLISLDATIAAYDDIAARHGLTEGAVKAAAHRIRQGFRAALRNAIAQTVSTEQEIDDEIRHLFEVFGSP